MDAFHVQNEDLDWLLADFLERVPHAESAVLASSDGLRRARHGIEVDDADSLSAALSGLHSVGRSLGRYRGSDGAVRQIVIEHDDLVLFVMGAAYGTLLGVITGPQADPGTVGYEMAQLVKSFTPHLETAVRQPPRGDTGA